MRRNMTDPLLHIKVLSYLHTNQGIPEHRRNETKLGDPPRLHKNSHRYYEEIPGCGDLLVPSTQKAFQKSLCHENPGKRKKKGNIYRKDFLKK